MIKNDDERRSFYEGVSHIPDNLLLDWTMRIRSGERGPEIDGIARYIIQDFCLRQFLGKPQSSIALGWICDVFGAILEYKDARDALGLLPRANKRPGNPQRGWDIACWIDVAEKRGYARAEAVKLAADTFHTDESNVRKFIKNSPDWINPDLEVWDEYFRLKSRPLPSTRAGKK